jgi:hypothetical protein
MNSEREILLKKINELTGLMNEEQLWLVVDKMIGIMLKAKISMKEIEKILRFESRLNG